MQKATRSELLRGSTALELLAAASLTVAAEAEAAGPAGGVAIEAQRQLQEQVLLSPGGEHPASGREIKHIKKYVISNTYINLYIRDKQLLTETVLDAAYDYCLKAMF